MPTRNASTPVVIAAVVGLALWFAAALATGKREAWDASAYWLVAYPVAILISAFLGYTFPERPWRWAIVLFESQFLAMCLRNGDLGGLLPMGMILFAIIALPAVLAAKLASRLSERSEQGVE
jgi:hypothetical protein